MSAHKLQLLSTTSLKSPVLAENLSPPLAL